MLKKKKKMELVWILMKKEALKYPEVEMIIVGFFF